MALVFLGLKIVESGGNMNEPDNISTINVLRCMCYSLLCVVYLLKRKDIKCAIGRLLMETLIV